MIDISNTFSKLLSTCLTSCFLFVSVVTPEISAQALSFSNQPLDLTTSFQPAKLTGVKIFPKEPFRFDFILDQGDHAYFNQNQVRKQSMKLIKYFMAALAVPEKDLWVNLSPLEQDRIIPEFFGYTDMGRDLLSQDYLLKQLTSSLMHPEKEIGENFWSEIYQKAYERFGSIDIPVDTFNKVWIVPEKASVVVDQRGAYILESKLDVMLEEDYVFLREKEKSGKIDDVENQSRQMAKNLVRETILPYLKQEVNDGEHFAPLRQIYHSLILAKWFKNHLKNSVLGQAYVGQNRVNGIDIEDKTQKEKIYEQYVQLFEQGVFDFIKEEYDPINQTIVPKRYFSGGMTFFGEDLDEAMLELNFEEWKNVLNDLIDQISNKLLKIKAKVLDFSSNKFGSSFSNQLSSSVELQAEDFDEEISVGLEEYISYRKIYQIDSDSVSDVSEFLSNPVLFKQTVQREFEGKKEARVENLIKRQASLEQALIELIANASDAQMRKKSPIRLFGVGALQKLRFILESEELGDEGIHIIVNTKTENDGAFRILFFKGDDGKVKFNIKPSQKRFQGTNIQIKFPQTIESSLQNRLIKYMNDKVGRFTKMPIYHNGNKVNSLKDFKYFDGYSLSYQELDQQIDVVISDDQIIVEDQGTGMDKDVILNKYLVPRVGKSAQLTIEEELKPFYKGEISSLEKKRSRISFQVSDIEIESGVVEGYGLPEELVVPLSYKSQLTVTRNKIKIDQTTVDTFKQVSQSILDLPEEEKYVWMNIWMKAADLLQKKNERKTQFSLTEAVKNVFVPELLREKRLMLPNEPLYHQMVLPSDVLFVHPDLLYKATPELIPGAEDLKEFFQAGSFQKAYIVPFQEASDVTYLTYGPYLLINQKIYEHFKDEPMLLNLRLNFYVGYGRKPQRKGWILSPEEAEKNIKHQTKEQVLENFPDLHSIIDMPQLNWISEQTKPTTVEPISPYQLSKEVFTGFVPVHQVKHTASFREQDFDGVIFEKLPDDILEKLKKGRILSDEDLKRIEKLDLFNMGSSGLKNFIQINLDDFAMMSRSELFMPDGVQDLFSRINEFVKKVPQNLHSKVNWKKILPFNHFKKDLYRKYLNSPGLMSLPDETFLLKNIMYFSNESHPDRIGRYLDNLVLIESGQFSYISDSNLLHSVLSQIDMDGLELLNEDFFQTIKEVFENRNLEDFEKAFKGINRGIKYVKGEQWQRFVSRWLKLYQNDPDSIDRFYGLLDEQYAGELVVDGQFVIEQFKQMIPEESSVRKTLKIREYSAPPDFSGYYKNGQPIFYHETNKGFEFYSLEKNATQSFKKEMPVIRKSRKYENFSVLFTGSTDAEGNPFFIHYNIDGNEQSARVYRLPLVSGEKIELVGFIPFNQKIFKVKMLNDKDSAGDPILVAYTEQENGLGEQTILLNFKIKNNLLEMKKMTTLPQKGWHNFVSHNGKALFYIAGSENKVFSYNIDTHLIEDSKPLTSSVFNGMNSPRIDPEGFIGRQVKSDVLSVLDEDTIIIIHQNKYLYQELLVEKIRFDGENIIKEDIVSEELKNIGDIRVLSSTPKHVLFSGSVESLKRYGRNTALFVLNLDSMEVSSIGRLPSSQKTQESNIVIEPDSYYFFKGLNKIGLKHNGFTRLKSIESSVIHNDTEEFEFLDIDYLIQSFQTLSKQRAEVLDDDGQAVTFERSGFQALNWIDNLSGFPSLTRRILQFLKEKNVKLVGQGQPLDVSQNWKKINGINQEIPLAALNYLFDKNAQDLLSKKDITFVDFLNMLDDIKDKNFSTYVEMIRSAMKGEDAGDYVWIRERVQNSRDAIRHARRQGLLNTEEGQMDLRSYNHQGHWVFEVKDNGIGMNLLTLLTKFFPLDQSSKDITKDTGNLGLGAYTAYSHLLHSKNDREVLWTSNGDGFIYQIILRGDPELGPVIESWDVYAGDFRGAYALTMMDQENIEPQIQGFLSEFALRDYAGGILSPETKQRRGMELDDGDVKITFDGETFEKDFDIIAETEISIGEKQGKIYLARGLDENIDPQLYQDHILVRQLNWKEFDILPLWLQKAFERYGVTYILLSKDFVLDIPRTDYAEEHKFLNELQLSVLHLVSKGVLRDYVEKGAKIPGRSPDYFFNAGVFDNIEAQKIAEFMYQKKYSEINRNTLQKFLESPYDFFEVLSHVIFTSDNHAGELNLHIIREEKLRKAQKRKRGGRKSVLPVNPISVEQALANTEFKGNFDQEIKDAENFLEIDLNLNAMSKEELEQKDTVNEFQEFLKSDQKVVVDFLTFRILEAIAGEKNIPLLFYDDEKFTQAIAGVQMGKIYKWFFYNARDIFRGLHDFWNDKDALQKALFEGQNGSILWEFIDTVIHESSHLDIFEDFGGHSHQEEETIEGFSQGERIKGFGNIMGRNMDNFFFHLKSQGLQLKDLFGYSVDDMKKYVDQIESKAKGSRKDGAMLKVEDNQKEVDITPTGGVDFSSRTGLFQVEAYGDAAQLNLPVGIPPGLFQEGAVPVIINISPIG